MLSKYDRKLAELRDKMNRRGETQQRKSELEMAQARLDISEQSLLEEVQRRQAEVERLSKGIWAVWYTLIGKKAELTQTAQAELESASAAYEEAARRAKQSREQIEMLSWDLSDMANAETRYRETLDEKLQAMRASGIETEKILPIDEKLRLIQGKLRETEQACTAGRRVIGQMENIETELYEAEKYGRIDLYGLNKSSAFSQIGKYVHVDNAQHHAKNLQRFIDEFQKELSDVQVNVQIYVQIDSFTRFADWFFDGIFADLAALRRIEESHSSVCSARIGIERILEKLQQMKTELTFQAAELQKELYAIAENTR